MTHSTPLGSFLRGLALLALACAFVLSFVSAPMVLAADKALPVKATFEKITIPEGVSFVLHLKNESKDTLKLSGKVLLSVVNHAMDKARALPEHTLAAGEVWSITDLSAADKVVVSAAGFASLEVQAPFKP